MLTIIRDYPTGFCIGHEPRIAMNQSESLLARTRAKFPDCTFAHMDIDAPSGRFVSMVASGGYETGAPWRVAVTTRHSYEVTPPELAFVIKYGRCSREVYSQEVRGTIKDAEERMFQIIGDDLQCAPGPHYTANIVALAVIGCIALGLHIFQTL